MPHKDPVTWQPIREMPLIAGMIDGALDDTREHLETWPGVVRCAARQPSIASSVNQTVRLPRWRRTAS